MSETVKTAMFTVVPFTTMLEMAMFAAYIEPCTSGMPCAGLLHLAW